MKKMKKTGKRLFSLLLAGTMILTIAPTAALADDDEPTSCTITFHTGAGEEVAYFHTDQGNAESMSKEYELDDYIDSDKPGELIVADADHYEFAGWSEQKDASEPEYSMEADRDKDVYAVWNRYALLTQDANGGQIQSDDDEWKDSLVEREWFPIYGVVLFFRVRFEVRPPEDGWSFQGWYDQKEGGKRYEYEDTYTGDLTLYAHWQKPVVLSLEEKTAVTQENSTGYFTFTPSEDGDYRLEASPSEDDYVEITVEEKKDGELQQIASYSGYVNEDETDGLTMEGLKAQTTYYCKVTSWNNDFFSGTLSVRKLNLVNVTFHANHKDAYYSIEVDGEEERSESSTAKYEAGELLYQKNSISKNTPSYDDSKIYMKGWATEKNAKEPSSEAIHASDGLELYGVWSERYPVTFDVNKEKNPTAYYSEWDDQGETVEKDTRVISYDEDSTVYRYDNEPSWDEETYRLLGWSTDPNASKPDSKIVIKGETTIYAVWKKIHTVTFDANGGYIDDDGDHLTKVSVAADEDDLVYAPTARHKDAFTAFNGWYDAAEGGKEVDLSKAVADSFTVYAHWKKVSEVELAHNTLVTAASEDANQVLYSFKPTQDGFYVFNSADARSFCPEVILYNAQKEEIARKSDGGYGDNFLLVEKLNANETYYYSIVNKKNGAFRYPVKIERIPSVKLTLNANLDGATVMKKSIAEMEIPSGIAADLPVAESDRENVRFMGWAYQKDASNADEMEEKFTKDVTLYAVWSKTVQATFDLNSENAYFEEDEDENPIRKKTVTVTENSDLADYSFSFERNGEERTLVGWSLNKNAAEPDEEIRIDENKTIYAVWKTEEQISQGEYEIAAGESKVIKGKGCAWIKFTPTEDGRYEIFSSANSVWDPYVELYDGKKEEYLDYNDDGAGNLNFLLEAEMKKGETRYYKASVYSGSSTAFSYTVTVRKIKTREITLHLGLSTDEAWFEGKDGKATSDKTDIAVVGRNYSKEDFNTDGKHFFQGWATTPNAESGGFNIWIDENTTDLYAVWKEGVTVTLYTGREDANFWDYSEDGPRKVQSTTIIKEKGSWLGRYSNEPYYSNKEISFLGWSKTKGAVAPDPEIILNEDGTYYAVWGKKAYVTYAANGGLFSGGRLLYTATYRNDTSLLDDDWYVPHHRDEQKVFAGWATTPNATEPDVDMDRATAGQYDGKVLYAVWQKAVSVTLHANAKSGYFRDSMHNQVKEITLYMAPGSQIQDLDYYVYSSDRHMQETGQLSLTANGAAANMQTELTEGMDLYLLWQDMVIITYDPGENGTVFDEAKFEHVYPKGSNLNLIGDIQAAHEDPSMGFYGWSTDGRTLLTEYKADQDGTLIALYRTGHTVTIEPSVNGITAVYANGRGMNTRNGAASFTWADGAKASGIRFDGTPNAGYIWLGLSTDGTEAGLIGGDYAPAADVTLKSVFVPGNRVELYPQPGRFINSAFDVVISVRAGQKIGSIPAIEAPAGYVLKGWRDLSDSTNTVITTGELENEVPDRYTEYQAVYEKGAGSFDISMATITGLKDQTYTGSAITQKPVVTLDGRTLTEGTDYTVSISNNVNAGTATVTVTGAGSYTGTATGSFTIRAKAVTPTITLSKDVFTYNGKVQKPAVTVRNGQTTMAASAYTVAYGNAKSTNAGTYAVTVTMRGNYSGKATSGYQIKAKKITPKIALSKTAFTYNAKIQKPSVTVKNGNTKLAKSTYTVTYSNTKSKNVGIYKVTVKMKGNFSGTAASNYRINPAGTTISKVTAKKKGFALTWKKQAVQTTGYQVQYSLSAKFTKPGTKMYAKTGTVKAAISGLKPAKKYYVRIRTFKKIGKTTYYYSAWSAAKTVTTKK